VQPKQAVASRRACRRPVRVIGDCPPDTVCLHCRQSGNVKRVVDATAVGGKSKMLHPSCAETWFGNLGSTTIELDVPIDDAPKPRTP
jgi:hypothetical protein